MLSLPCTVYDRILLCLFLVFLTLFWAFLSFQINPNLLHLVRQTTAVLVPLHVCSAILSAPLRIYRRPYGGLWFPPDAALPIRRMYLQYRPDNIPYGYLLPTVPLPGQLLSLTSLRGSFSFSSFSQGIPPGHSGQTHKAFFLQTGSGIPGSYTGSPLPSPSLGRSAQRMAVPSSFCFFACPA